MKILKFILFGLLGLVALILIIAAFLPSESILQRSIEIKKPAELVYNQVADFNNWPAWNPWTEMDPTAKATASGTPKAVGAVWAWNGKDTGSGKMTIDSVSENRFLRTQLHFIEPMEGKAISNWKFEPTANGTMVTWDYKGEANYPMGRIFGALFTEKFLGGAYEKGLTNLKAVCEKQ